MKKLIDKKIKPMLCKTGKAFNDKGWIFELKIDGTRALFFFKNGKLKIQNRRLKDITYRYPEFSDLPKFIKAKEAILDGEIVILNEEGKPDFYKLATREQTSGKLKIKFLSKTIPATYFAFDIIYKDGKDLRNVPLIERKKILKSVIKKNKYLLFLDYIKEKGKEFFKAVKKNKLEGIVGKRINSIYEPGRRSENWIKIKTLKTADCVIVGYTEGKGKRKETFGALVLAVYDGSKLKYVGRVGTGWNEEELEKITKTLNKYKTKEKAFKRMPEELRKKKITWLKPKIVCEVKYMNISPHMELRAPSFQRIRFDKSPKECVLSELK